MIDYKTFVDNSRKWLKAYIQNNHLQSLVIGISGGIDSTISCTIASLVCKELDIPLIGRSLPTNSNEVSEINAADLVGKAFCYDYEKVNIHSICQNFQKFIEDSEYLPSTSLQYGNIKARIRMIYLRHLASVYKGVVLDNDNFTEWNLGFWTVAGDSPMDINLGLHYLWKTEIYELADYLYNSLTKKGKKVQANAIWKSMSLMPTDGNGVSKNDCEQFGLENYEQVNDVLKTMYYSPFTSSEQEFINGHTDTIPKEYIRLINSYNEQGVDKVMLLHQNTEYKRKPSPIMPTREELGL